MDTLSVKLHTIDDKAMFHADARDNPEIVVDYFPPIGTGKGYTSLELLMVSLGTCVSTTLLGLLRYRMKKTVSSISAEVNGIVRDEHPKALEHIRLTLKISAADLSDSEVKEALQVAENEICPVWAMLKGNVAVEVVTVLC